MKRRFGLLVIMAVLLVLGVSLLTAQNNPPSEQELYEGTVPAPEFPDGLDWLNVDAPLTLDGLRGKIILLDFWTYGCINCIHMIPVLEELETKYANELVVIGVHSAKFENEGQTDNIRQIVKRYDLHHPVINDSDFRVWRTFGINAWPTFAIIDPRGNVVAIQSGEIPFTAFDRYLGGMIAYYDNLGQNDIDRTPLKLALESAQDTGTLLRYPGKVLADATSNRLFIADSNHHRLIVADLTTYEVQAVIGSGTRGAADGNYAAAQFNKPQGMALKGDKLYVADVNNHVIRQVDLTAQTVTTIAGTGNMGRGGVPFDLMVSDPLQFDLRSPWDVTFGENDLLYIAMAGNHQLWQLDLATNTLKVAVGSGREAQSNGSLRMSGLAQPSGLYYQAGLLYFADSESSTIRVADFANDNVSVISGTTEDNLFDFGDIDGAYGTNRLQHALGVVGAENGLLYIADTYNSKIKVYDPTTRTTTTLLGLGGEGGFRDGDVSVAEFDEPGGISYANGKLYVADTNNHALRVIDLATTTVSTISFPNPAALKMPDQPVTVIGGNAADGASLVVDAQTVSAGMGEIVLQFTLPAGYKLNTVAQSVIEIANSGDPFSFPRATWDITDTEARIPVEFTSGSGELDLQITLFYCEAEEQSVCLVDRLHITAPVTVGEGSSTITIPHTVILPAAYR